jgi:electron transfer flavoprotein alpha subunit
MEKKYGPVWVIADLDSGTIRTITLQLIGQAVKLADKQQTCVEVILLGNKFDNSILEPLFAAGAQKVYVGDAPQLLVYNSETYSDIIVDLSRKYQPEIILTGSTDMGRELAPLIAAKLETGLSAHCIDLVINNDGILEMIIPAYSGLITIICPERRPQMATVASGVFKNPKLNHNLTGDVIRISSIPEASPRIKTIDIVKENTKTVKLDSASIVVAGGAGAKNSDGWQQVSDLADVLKAGLGSTRPAVDEGWIGIETMIGQSGRMVNPKLYVGIGISGDQQHMIGITGAKIMVAINNDKNSSIFEQVDYGIVDDCHKFIPAFIGALNLAFGK